MDPQHWRGRSLSDAKHWNTLTALKKKNQLRRIPWAWDDMGVRPEEPGGSAEAGTPSALSSPPGKGDLGSPRSEQKTIVRLQYTRVGNTMWWKKGLAPPSPPTNTFPPSKGFNFLTSASAMKSNQSSPFLLRFFFFYTKNKKLKATY